MIENIRENIIPISIIILSVCFFIFIIKKQPKIDNFKKNNKQDFIDKNKKYQKVSLSPYFYYTNFLNDKIRLNNENNKKILDKNLLNNKKIVNINYLVPSQNYMQMRI